jgi:calcineurin-like phosphoesterase family protein
VGEIEKNYNARFEEGKGGDGYFYFTDPHPVTTSFNATLRSGFEEKLGTLAELYGHSKASFAVCGGDWFNNSNSKESALNMLAYIREMTTKLFGTCYLVVGNHDYNYQYVTNGTNGKSEYWLTAEELAGAWYPDNEGKTYYSFATENTRYYVFDSGIDWNRQTGVPTDYDKVQISWYLEELMKNDDKHIVLMPHMVHASGSTDNWNGGTLAYATISAAYNNRETYTYNGVEYDFSEKTGMVEYIIAGHNHSDHIDTIAGIPYILVATNNQGDPATSYFVYAAYEARKLYFYRVGKGEC